MKREVLYLESSGPHNTERCIDIVEGLVKEGYRHVVVASISGDTGLRVAKRLEGKGVNLVVVTHSSGFKKENHQEFQASIKEEIERLGGHVFTGTILTHSLETSLVGEFQGVYPTTLIALTLRRLGQGLKVCCEIVMEACDAGLIPEGEEIVAVGGKGSSI